MTPTPKLSSFPNRTFALRVFPSSITFLAETIFLTEFLLTPVTAAVFAITAPALNCGLFPLLLSSWKYFATFSILFAAPPQNRSSAFSLGRHWKWWSDVSHLPVDPEGKLARAWATFYNRRHQLSNKFLCLSCQWRPLLCQTY